MLSRDSRYDADFLSFRADSPEGTSFQGTRAREIQAALGVLEHMLVAGDRLDLLALHYYNDPAKWWLILDANPSILYAGSGELDEHLGRVIVIPRARAPGRLG